MTLPVDELIDFVNHQRVSERLQPFSEKFGPMELRFLAITLLGWWKHLAGSSSQRALRVDGSYTWHAPLIEFITSHVEMKRLFQVVDGEIRFRKEIGDDERRVIARTADLGYQPKLRT